MPYQQLLFQRLGISLFCQPTKPVHLVSFLSLIIQEFNPPPAYRSVIPVCIRRSCIFLALFFSQKKSVEIHNPNIPYYSYDTSKSNPALIVCDANSTDCPFVISILFTGSAFKFTDPSSLGSTI